jgi:hypothetical protein
MMQERKKIIDDLGCSKVERANTEIEVVRPGKIILQP